MQAKYLGEHVMTIREELTTLQHKFGGVLRAEDGVEWARRNTMSALHAALEWDDGKAGHAYRIWQVRQLIAVHVINEKGQRQMVSLTIDRREGGYRDLNTVLDSAPMREVLLADALAELERVKLKYEQLVELASVWEAVADVRRKQVKKSPSSADS